MKTIGITKGGTMIVELNLSEARALKDMARELEKGTLSIVPTPVVATHKRGRNRKRAA
jgi:hypothetical protein